MVLSDKSLLDKHLECGLVSPVDKSQFGPASVDLTLADDFVDEDGRVIEDQSMLLLPGQFILARTTEVVSVPNGLVGIVKGKSSLARQGLIIECAGLVDPGFSGTITLEIKNLNQRRKLLLEPGQKICQIIYTSLDCPADNPYSSQTGHHYQGQLSTTRSYLDEDRKLDAVDHPKIDKI